MERIVLFCGGFMTIVGAITWLTAKVKYVVKNMGAVIEGQKCQLRADMLRTYYRHKDDGKIRQYEYENFIHSYKAYKALGGNSFIEHINGEVRDWEVIS